MRRLRSRLRGVTYPVVANSETTSLLARMSTYPGNARAYQIDTLIGALKTGGVWAKLDALYVLAAHEQASAVLNWRSTSYNLTSGTPPTFVADRYVQGNGSTQFYDTGFDPTTAVTPNFVQNSAHLGIWQVLAGSNQPAGATSVVITPATPNTIIRINSGSGVNQAAAAATGHFIGNRPDSANVIGYYNGSPGSLTANASSAPGAESFYVAARNQAADTFNNSRIAIVHFGSSLSGSEAAAAYNAFATYLSGVGAI